MKCPILRFPRMLSDVGQQHMPLLGYQEGHRAMPNIPTHFDGEASPGYLDLVGQVTTELLGT